MRWSYKTVHYMMKKERLSGSTFLDEDEIETSLNEYGRAGWELVSVVETLEGLNAIFKQPLDERDDFVPDAGEKKVSEERCWKLKENLEEKKFSKIAEAVMVTEDDTEEVSASRPVTLSIERPGLRNKKNKAAVYSTAVGSIRIC
ncbi:DUF4177 domain-containing protein [Desulforhopalus vacuolatus]|uniref:DUF4177 domain-containing protein n=1 Tax=Desulforhopalus vacuolatus TaxID=40414 RepID=UPI001963C2B6|nr:DUF4177 domain-containing protein [Desulforhopalus vacuolatus]MBM9519898.1 DUF4177 domain-containing protein [Desulforhopalus vacuolatus]